MSRSQAQDIIVHVLRMYVVLSTYNSGAVRMYMV